MTGQGPRWRHWLARFGWAEACGFAGSYAGFFGLSAVGAGPELAAFGAALGENAGYYGTIFLRDWRALPSGERRLRPVLLAMLHDFGIAEALDTLVVRPGITLSTVSLLGEAMGVGAGKIAADVVFYALALVFYERRRARECRR